MVLVLSVIRCPDLATPEQRRVPGGEYVLGRGAECDWVLRDPDRVLSKRHCAVEFLAGQWQVRDLSTNGTTVNSGDPLGRDRTVALRDGDRLRLGAYEIECRVEDEAVHGSGRWQSARAIPDPMAGPAVTDIFSVPLPGLSPPAGGTPAGHAPLLPADFDPFAPDDHGPAMPDHRPSTSDVFTPPRATMPDLLPDDWAAAPGAAGNALDALPDPFADAPPGPPARPAAPLAGDDPFAAEVSRLPDPFADLGLPSGQSRVGLSPAPTGSDGQGSAAVGATPRPAVGSADVAGTPPFAADPFGSPAHPPAADGPHPSPVANPFAEPSSTDGASPFAGFAAGPFDAPVSHKAPAPVADPFAAPAASLFATPLAPPSGAPVAAPAPAPAAPPAFAPGGATPNFPSGTPAVPSTASAIDPFGPAEAAVSSAPLPAVASPPAGAPTGGLDAALALLLRSAGLGVPPPGTDAAVAITAAGAALRASVAGMRALLIARADVKREFRIEQTMLRAAGNNPVKFAATDDQAMQALLSAQGNAPAALAETVRDLTAHQVATLAATQAAARALLTRLAPAPLESATPAGGIMPGAREKALWAAYRKLHDQVTTQFDDDFDSAFGKAFARAYEEAARSG